MAVWTPGSYLVREYERHIENIAAHGPDGRARPLKKTRKNRWSIETGGAPTVTATYRVYGREMTVRNNWIESRFAMLNGAPTFLTLVDGMKQPHEVRIDLPPAWNGVATPLMRVSERPNTFVADNFDTLVDSPIILGNPVTREFDVAETPHYLVLEGDTAHFDVTRAAADVRKIVEAGGTLMGRYDYPHYYFLNLLTEASGGLEHKNSFLGTTSRFTTRTRRSYRAWLGLLAHEYFHNWNGKRLRPIELGPFDYENEVHTRALWIVEGFTDYYCGILLRRAALSTRDEFLEDLSNMIEDVQSRPGRLVTPAVTASFDAWIKQYRPDENTLNTTIDYYSKGGVIAFLLDARIRHSTNGAKSLDDAMRLAYARYSGESGYTLEQFYEVMGEVAGVDLQPWFTRVAETTEELDYQETLEWFGLRFRPVDARTKRAWLGASTRVEGGRLVVSHVRRDGPASECGLNVDDEIIAVDDLRVRPDGLATRLEQYRPGDKVSLLVARRDRLIRLDGVLGTELGRAWRLEVSPSASDMQAQHLAGWVGSVT